MRTESAETFIVDPEWRSRVFAGTSSARASIKAQISGPGPISKPDSSHRSTATNRSSAPVPVSNHLSDHWQGDGRVRLPGYGPDDPAETGPGERRHPGVSPLTLSHVTIRHIAALSALAALILMAFAACGGGDSRKVADIAAASDTGSFELNTRAFAEGGRIPARHTCDGDDRSIPLSWSGAPEGTESFALLFDDPDAPGGTFKHWIIFDIPPTAVELLESVDTAARVVGTSIQLKNDFGRRGYGGPCPPEGETHTYRLFLYAMDTRLQIPANSSQGRVLDAIEEHALARAGLSGTYDR